MIVPAQRKFYSPARFLALKDGEDFHTDSGLGGSWRLVFVRYDGERLIFVRQVRPDWPEETFSYPNAEEAAKHLYILVAENPHL